MKFDVYAGLAGDERAEHICVTHSLTIARRAAAKDEVAHAVEAVKGSRNRAAVRRAMARATAASVTVPAQAPGS